MSNRFTKLSPEKQANIRKIGKKFILRSLLIGLNAGALLVISNICVVLLKDILRMSNFDTFILCVMVDIVFLNMMNSSMKKNLSSTRQATKKELE